MIELQQTERDPGNPMDAGLLLGGQRVVLNETLTRTVEVPLPEGWLARLVERLRRRWRPGRAFKTVPRDCVYAAGDELHMHPATWADLRRALQKRNN